MNEVQLSIERILQHPVAWPMMESSMRRALVRRFPYGIIYTVMRGQIFILAVMHLHRLPEYWKSRG